MNILSWQVLASYWNMAEMASNAVIFLNLLGSLALGLMVGYERSYRGRAAGMRTYGLVCMASCAIMVITGYTNHWYGGTLPAQVSAIDPARVIQGVCTGIGFLGAGVIMRDGLNISGLTTAASIWAVSAVGVLVGVGFYVAAIGLALMSTFLMKSTPFCPLTTRSPWFCTSTKTTCRPRTTCSNWCSSMATRWPRAPSRSRAGTTSTNGAAWSCRWKGI
jgi:hypothetical protein